MSYIPSAMPTTNDVYFLEMAATQTTTILLLKLFASSGSINCAESFAGQGIIWFADNGASVRTTIKGACWVECINSGSNPADRLSRQGLADPLFGTVHRSLLVQQGSHQPTSFSDASRSEREVSLLVVTDLCARWGFTLGLMVSAGESSLLPADTFVFQRA